MSEEFSVWVDKAEDTRNSLKQFLDRVKNGNASPPVGFTRDDFLRAAEEQMKSLTESLKNFGRV